LVIAALRPSEYTAALIHVLRANTACVQGATVLEVGSGCGMVFAALGAGSLCGIDIEKERGLRRACCCWKNSVTAGPRSSIAATCGCRSATVGST
jgi:hypothetical protein